MSVPQEQMMAAMAQEAPPVSDSPELVGGVPAEQLPEEVTVADDVPRDVEEGAFVINAPAAEYMGYNDLAEMLLNAMKKARELGLDKSESGDTISDEDVVNLLVSKGEVLIPPHLAKIIGYDTLNKINARGEREVSKRLEEAEKEPSQEQLVAQQAQAQEAPIQAMAEGGKAGFMDVAMSPKKTYDDVSGIIKFTEESTDALRKADGTKALAIDNKYDAYRHVLGSALLYQKYSTAVASSMLDLNEVKGMAGDYLASAGGGTDAKLSRDMDYHNNDVARNLVASIPTDKLSQMTDRAMEAYVRRYFDEVQEAIQDGSVSAIDPSLVPMFAPEGIEQTPEPEPESLYIKGPDGNWMENPKHPDVKARQQKAVGGKARMPSAEKQANYTAQYIDPSDRVIDGSAISRAPVDQLPRMKEVPYGDKPIEQDPFDELMDAAEGKESNVDKYPEVMDAETYFNFTQTLRPKVGKEISTEEAIKTLKVARDMISDREHAKYLEMLEKSKTPGDKVLGRPYAPDYDYSDKGYFYYDEDDDMRLTNENKPPRVT